MESYARFLVHLKQDEHRGELLVKLRKLLQADSQVELFSHHYSAAVAGSTLFDPEKHQHAIQSLLRQIERGLQSHTDKLEQLGVKAGADVSWGRDEAETLVRKVMRYKPDLVMHAPDTHPDLLQRILGAPEWRLLRLCPAPLLLSKKQHWNERPIIAAAIDPFHLDDETAELDQLILTHAQRLAEQVDGELHVLHVYQTLPHSAIFDEHLVMDYEQLQKKVRADHRARIQALISPLNLSIDDPCVHLLEGELSQCVPEWSERIGVDVLVMGSLARGFVDRLLLGSSAERLLERVSCDLMVLKPDSFHCPVDEF